MECDYKMSTFIFEIPSSGLKELEQTREDDSENVYMVQTAMTVADVEETIQEIEEQMTNPEPDFIFKNFDVFFHALKLYSQFDQAFRDRIWLSLRQLYNKNLKDLITYLEMPNRSESQAMLNRLKMYSFLFFTCCEYNEDKALAFANRPMEEEQPGKKRQRKKQGVLISSAVYHRSKSNVLGLLLRTLTLKLEQLFEQKSDVQSYINFMLKYVYVLIANIHGFKNDQTLMRSLCDVFDVAIKRYDHSERFCQKVIELLQNSEELSSSLAALVNDSIKNNVLECNQLMSQLAKIQINDLSKDSSVPKAVSLFLIEVGKESSEQMLNCLNTLILMLDQDSHMVRNAVFEIIYIIIIEHFRQVDNYRDSNIRDQLMSILEDYIRDTNGYCRSKVIKLWTMLAEAELITRERYNTLTPKIAARLEDKSNFVRKSALAFLIRVCYILIPCQGLKEIFSTYHDFYDRLREAVQQQSNQNKGTMKDLQDMLTGNQSIRMLKDQLMNSDDEKDDDDNEDDDGDNDEDDEDEEDDEEDKETDAEDDEKEKNSDNEEMDVDNNGNADDDDDEVLGKKKKKNKKKNKKKSKENNKKAENCPEDEMSEEELKKYADDFDDILDVKTLVTKWNKIRLELFVFMQIDDDFENGLTEIDEDDLKYHSPMLAFNHFRRLMIVKDFTKAMALLPALKRKYPKAKEFEINQNNDVFLNNFHGPVDNSIKLARQIFLYPLLEMAEQNNPTSSQSHKTIDADHVKGMLEKFQNDCAEQERQEQTLARFKEIIELIDQYDSFHDIIADSLPKIYDMLNSTIINDVLEAIGFFVMAYNLKLKNSEKGIQKMLLLIRTKDKAIKERLLQAFNQIYMNEKTECDADIEPNDENESPELGGGSVSEAGKRDDSNKVTCFREIKNLLVMIKPLNQGELICAEYLISEMYGKNMFSKTHVNILWGLYRGYIKRSPDEQRLAFIVLGMIACSDPSIILDQLSNVCFSYVKTIPWHDEETLIPDYELAMRTSYILSRIYPVPTIENSEQFFKIDNNHQLFKVIFRLLLRGLKCTSSDPEYKNCKLFYSNLVIRSMEVIYLYSKFPDRLIRDIMLPADDFIRSFTSLDGNTERVMTPHSNTASQDIPLSQTSNATSLAGRVNTVCLEADYIERFLYLITAIAKGFLLHMGYAVLRENQIRKRQKDMDKQKVMEERKKKKAAKTASKQNREFRTDVMVNDYSSSDDDEANAEFGGSMGNDCTVPDYIQNQVFDVELFNNNGFLSKYFNFVKGITYDILGRRFPIGVRIAAWHAMCNFMIASKNITLKYRNVFSDCLTNCPDDEIRAILITYWGDILMRFPNQIEYLNVKLFNFLTEDSRLLKTTALKTLSMIILADMLKPTGEVVHLAKLIVDPDDEIQNLTRLFFVQIANKDNQNIYNYLTDVISTHAGSKSTMTEAEFQEMVKFLFDLLEKNKSTESLIKKLSERFLDTNDTRLWRDLSFALQLVNYQEKSLQALLTKWPYIRATLTNPVVFENFQSLLQKLQTQFKESKNPTATKMNEAIADLESKLEYFRTKAKDGDEKANKDETSGADTSVEQDPGAAADPSAESDDEE